MLRVVPLLLVLYGLAMPAGAAGLTSTAISYKLPDLVVAGTPFEVEIRARDRDGLLSVKVEFEGMTKKVQAQGKKVITFKVRLKSRRSGEVRMKISTIDKKKKRSGVIALFWAKPQNKPPKVVRVQAPKTVVTGQLMVVRYTVSDDRDLKSLTVKSWGKKQTIRIQGKEASGSLKLKAGKPGTGTIKLTVQDTTNLTSRVSTLKVKVTPASKAQARTPSGSAKKPQLATTLKSKPKLNKTSTGPDLKSPPVNTGIKTAPATLGVKTTLQPGLLDPKSPTALKPRKGIGSARLPPPGEKGNMTQNTSSLLSSSIAANKVQDGRKKAAEGARVAEITGGSVKDISFVLKRKLVWVGLRGAYSGKKVKPVLDLKDLKVTSGQVSDGRKKAAEGARVAEITGGSVKDISFMLKRKLVWVGLRPDPGKKVKQVPDLKDLKLTPGQMSDGRKTAAEGARVAEITGGSVKDISFMLKRKLVWVGLREPPAGQETQQVVKPQPGQSQSDFNTPGRRGIGDTGNATLQKQGR